MKKFKGLIGLLLVVFGTALLVFFFTSERVLDFFTSFIELLVIYPFEAFIIILLTVIILLGLAFMLAISFMKPTKSSKKGSPPPKQ